MADIDDIPFEVNVLAFGRCVDCQNRNGGDCLQGIGGWRVLRGDELSIEPGPAQGHYCLEFKGVPLTADVVVLPKMPKQAPRAAMAQEVATQATRQPMPSPVSKERGKAKPQASLFAVSGSVCVK